MVSHAVKTVYKPLKGASTLCVRSLWSRPVCKFSHRFGRPSLILTNKSYPCLEGGGLLWIGLLVCGWGRRYAAAASVSYTPPVWSPHAYLAPPPPPRGQLALGLGRHNEIPVEAWTSPLAPVTRAASREPRRSLTWQRLDNRVPRGIWLGSYVAGNFWNSFTWRCCKKWLLLDAMRKTEPRITNTLAHFRQCYFTLWNAWKTVNEKAKVCKRKFNNSIIQYIY